MTTYYKATFSNGSVQTRSTMDRKYTHAWLVGFQSSFSGSIVHEAGFSGSEQLARKALATWKRKLTFSDIAPTVEITSKEYRALKAAS